MAFDICSSLAALVSSIDKRALEKKLSGKGKSGGESPEERAVWDTYALGYNDAR